MEPPQVPVDHSSLIDITELDLHDYKWEPSQRVELWDNMHVEKAEVTGTIVQTLDEMIQFKHDRPPVNALGQTQGPIWINTDPDKIRILGTLAR